MNQQLQDFLAQYGDTDGVLYLGHAGLLVVIGGKKILFDPIIESQPYGDSWVFFPPQLDDPALYEVDAVIVSHIHQDHYDLPFLRALKPSVKVAIVGQRPSFEADIQANAGREITIIAPETVTELLDGVFVYGVTHESNGVDSSVIAYNDRFCVYHGNDNYLQPASMAKFNTVGVHIDVACIPYAYIHWYPFLMEYAPDKLHEKHIESERLVNMYQDDCLNVIDILKPSVVIPFGANLLIDDGNMHSDINMAVRTPVEFAAYARQRKPELAEVVLPMLAGDYAGKPDAQLKVTMRHVYGIEEYRDAANDFLRARPQKSVPSDWQAVDLAQFIGVINQRLGDGGTPIDNLLQFELDYLGQQILVEIDLLTYQAGLVHHFTEGRPVHRFRLDEISSAEWLNGKRFEEIIGKRRFTLRREPNLYLPDVLKIVNTVV